LVASRVGVSGASSSENSTSPAAVVGSGSAACHLGVPNVSGLAASQPGMNNSISMYTSLAAVGASGSAASHIGVPGVSVLSSSQPGMNNSSSFIVGVSGLAASRVGVSGATTHLVQQW
jgi:hypothetical protein